MSLCCREGRQAYGGDVKCPFGNCPMQNSRESDVGLMERNTKAPWLYRISINTSLFQDVTCTHEGKTRWELISGIDGAIEREFTQPLFNEEKRL